MISGAGLSISMPLSPVLISWKRRLQPEELAAARENGEALLDRLGLDPARRDDELAVAEIACALLDVESAAKKEVSLTDNSLYLLAQKDCDVLGDWLVARKEELHKLHWLSIHFPHPLDHQHLVPLRRPDPQLPELFVGHAHKLRNRDGFKLTDRRMSPREILDQVDYCMYCHDRDKDSCSKGMRDKAGGLKQNPLGIPLAGCPLHEKISEMHVLRRHGDSLGGLALVCLDNPMCPGTGHRICNDCMKGCIFQKQEPVNIPQIETSVLTDVLNMPYGLEIYGLLTRWNPLNVRRPYPLPYSGRNVLVVGLGPAGYTLAHHLLREGFGEGRFLVIVAVSRCPVLVGGCLERSQLRRLGPSLHVPHRRPASRRRSSTSAFTSAGSSLRSVAASSECNARAPDVSPASMVLSFATRTWSKSSRRPRSGWCPSASASTTVRFHPCRRNSSTKSALLASTAACTTASRPRPARRSAVPSAGWRSRPIRPDYSKPSLKSSAPEPGASTMRSNQPLNWSLLAFG